MLVGVGKDSLIVRLGLDHYDDAFLQPHVRKFDITGWAIKGWVLVELGGVEDDDQLKDWIERATKSVKALPPNRREHKMAKSQKPKDIDSYITKFPADVQVILEKVRGTIRRAAPDAMETISYMMPAFKQHGILVYFAAWDKHIGLYPPISGNKTLEKASARYAGPKGNLQFPLDEPIPYDLIEMLVKPRVKQDSENAAAKRQKK